jgi:uncharacterized protein YfaS (alpha-2-macroglobulin family)
VTHYRRKLAFLLTLTTLLLGGTLSASAQPRGIVRVWPNSGSRNVELNTAIGMQFDRAMQHESVAQALSIEPFAPLRLSWDPANPGERLNIQPMGQLLPSTVYRIAIGSSIRGANGAPVIDEPYAWSFTTRAPIIEFHFGDTLPVQFLTPRGGRGVPVRMLGDSLRLDATLYALDMPSFAARYAALEPGGQSEIDLAGLAVVERWQQQVEAVAGQPGAIALPAGTAPGLYVLDLRHETTLDTQTLLVYSDYALAARKGRKGLTAWASAIGVNRWEAGASMALYDRQGRLLSSAQANDEGVASFDSDAEAAFVVANIEGQQSLTGLDEAWLSDVARSRPPLDITGHVHTDKPIYRPGQVVHFKATLRQVEDEGLAPIALGTPISVTIRDGRNTAVAEMVLESDDFGSIAGNLTLGDEVALGRWSIELPVGGSLVKGGFQVEEYLKPDFKVEVETAEAGYARSDRVRVTVRAAHYHGAPVVDAEVTIGVYRDRSAPGGADPVFELSGTTDAAGEFSATVTVDAVGEWLFEAEVTDASRRPVGATNSVPVHASAIDLNLSARRSAVEVGRPVTLTLRTGGWQGAAIADTRVDLAFWRRIGSGDERVRDLTVTTDAGGSATLALDDLEPGQYRIEASARDTRGRRTSTAIELWIYDPQADDQWVGALEITTDQDRYAPGDVAQLMIKSPYRARALVTLEADEVYDERVIEIGGLTTVDFAIRAAHAPNAVARVLLWIPQDRLDDRAEGRLVFAETALAVPPEHRRLSVTVIPDRERYEPGEEASFTIRVRDAEGRPVQAQLSMALVDAALLALYPDSSGDILDAFWPERALTVDTLDGLQPSHWDARHVPPAGSTPGSPPPTPSPPPAAPPGSTMTPQPRPTSLPPTPAPSSTAAPSLPTPEVPTAAPPGPGVNAAQSNALRRNFPDTAYWNPKIVTGADGEVTVRLTLPDSLTTWQALVRAITVDTMAGQGSGSLQVHKPISADPVLPRFAVQGDSFLLDVLARNDLGGTLSGSCEIEAGGLFLIDPSARSLSLPYGKSVVARWSVVASEVGAGTVKASLMTPGGDDALELPFEVQPFTVPELLTESGSTRDRAEVHFALPFNAMPRDTRMDISVSTGVTHSVLEGIDELLGFPYGCVEQTTSKMLPNAVVGRLVNDLDLQAPEIRARLSEFMPVGIQKLYGFQHASGSWGFWQDGRNLYITAYVLHALTMIDAAGFDVDAQVTDRGFAWLEGALRSEPEARLRAYALYVMAEAGRGDAGQVERLWSERNQLDAFSQAAMALALSAARKDSQTELALDTLEAAALREGDTAHWPASLDNLSSWRSMASQEKSTAMALIALVRLRPESALAPMAARWLMENRQGSGWGSTQATVFAVVALTDYMITSGDPYATYDWRVLLDGEPIAAGSANEMNRATRMAPIVITGDQLSPGAHTLSFEKDGEGTLYYSMAARLSIYHDSYEPTEPTGLGIGVTRSYSPVAGPARPGGWQVGDVVNVRLTVNSTEDLWYVLVEDLLPAGFEALNDQLATEGGPAAGSGLPWRWDGYERKEIRDDRVSFFATQLARGTHTFDYAVRAITPGRFSARPAVAYAMYRSDVWGRSGSEQVAIAADTLAPRPPLLGDFDRNCKLSDFDARLVADGWADGWAAGSGRDITGDGLVSVRDIALASRHTGLVCGDAVPAPPEPAGSSNLHLRAPEELSAHRDFVLELLLADARRVGGFETTLSWPEGAFAVIGLEAGDLLPDMTLLGPVVGAEVGAEVGARGVRIGGFSEVNATAPGEAVLARLRLRPLRSGELRIELSGTQIVDVEGAEHRVTGRGVVLDPVPWSPSSTLYLPGLLADHAQR